MKPERALPADSDHPAADEALDAAIEAIAEAALRDPRYLAMFGDEAASLARGRADIAAGRVVPHEKVAEWLATWDSEGYRPFPREWLE